MFEECSPGRACSRFFPWFGLNLGSIWIQIWVLLGRVFKTPTLQILTPPHLQVQGNFKALPGQLLVWDSTF